MTDLIMSGHIKSFNINPKNKGYESLGSMVPGQARLHIVSRFGTENGEPVELDEDYL